MKIRLLTLFFILSGLTVFAQPTNDGCANATPIIIPISGNACVTSTLAGATDDGSYSACETAGSQEVWFTYIVNGASNTVTVSPTGATPATNLNVTIGSGGCAATGYNTCNSATGSGTATANWTYPQGTQVWIYVSSSGGTLGEFQICVNSVEVPPTTGSSCLTAARICDMNSSTFPMPNNINGFQPPCFTAALRRPMVFSFSVATTGLLNWRATPTCNTTNTEFDWAVYDITNGCPGTAVACNYNFTGTGLFFPVSTAYPQGMTGGPGAGCTIGTNVNSAAAELCPGVTVTAGQTYIIIIDQFTNTSNCSISFNFTGSTFQTAPTSDFTINPNIGCDNVTVTFANNSAGVATQLWNFGDSTTSTVANPPSKTYNVEGTYLVSLTTTAGNGCTDVSSQSVIVKPQPTVSVNNATACSGQPATLTATPSLTGGTYSWSPGGATTQSITVSPASTTVYTLTYNLNGCTATASGTVTVRSSSHTVNAGNDTTVCANQNIPLRAAVNPAGTYTYAWTPAFGIATPGNQNTTATVSSTTDYIVAVTDTGGCVKRDTIRANVNGAGPQVSASANPTTVCPGQQTQLDVSVIPTFCGISNTCGDTTRAVVGSGTTSQTGTFAQAPTMFGNYTKSYRNQMLYTAAELTAAFGGPCIIKAIGFNISVYNNNQILENYTIKVGCTNLTALTTWDNTLTTVYTPKNFQPTGPGWQTINFDNAYAWDGTSNLIVDVCWFNPNTNNNANNKVQCTNTATNTYLYSGDPTNQCGINGALTATTLRPNARFTYCNNQISSYNIAWTPNPATNTVSNPAIRNPTSNPVSNTTYSVVLSASGCSGSATVNVAVDTSRVNAGSDITICPGVASPLSATQIGSPIPGPATFAWTTLSGTNVGNTQNISVNPLVQTTYVVTMNGGACPKRDTVVVNIGSLSFTHTITPITCNGANNGKIKLVPTGTSPYTFSWSANAATGNVDSAVNLAPGTYYATITDANGCVAKDTVTFTQPTLVSFTNVITNVSCNGGSNGSIALTPSGGTGSGYTYSWSNAATNATNSGLIAGGYDVTVRDSNGCSATGTFNITQPTAISFNPPVIVNVRCFNASTGSITVSATGGTGAYTYIWSHNATLNSATASGLAANSYTVTITDANGCSVSATYAVTQPANGLTLSAPTVVDVSCFGGNNGSITVNPVGGSTPYTYAWGGGISTSQTATTLTAQSYSVTVTDDSLCSASASIAVNQPTQILIAGTVTDVSCFGGTDGSINITPSQGTPGYAFIWSNSAVTEDVSSLSQGNYRVTVTDNNSCTQTASYTVNQPNAVTLNAPTIVNVSCLGGNNGSITANASGGTPGYTYNWTPTAAGQTNATLIAGAYAVTASDANSCTASATYNVTEPATAVSFSTPTIADVLCNGASTGSITVSASGGTGAISYTWSHSASVTSATASNLPAATYTVTATDVNGCSISASHVVNQPTAITFGNSTATPVSCFGLSDGTGTVTPTGGTGSYTFTWNGNVGSNPQTGLSANTYTVVVRDSNNCTASTFVTITQPTQISVSLSAVNLTCSNANNGSVTATVTGGTSPYQYAWSVPGTTSTISNLAAGTYFVTVTDAPGCTTTSSTSVTQPAVLSVNATSVQVSCSGTADGSITANANGGTNPYSFDLVQNGTILQSNFTGSFSLLNAGDYTVNTTDINNCVASTNINVPAPISDVFALTTDSTSCYGSQYNDGEAHIIGLTFTNQPYRFSIDGGPYQLSGDFYFLTAGNHVITARNNFGCDTVIRFIVPEPVNATASITPSDTTIQLGQSIALNSTFGPYPSSSIVGYNWVPSAGLSCNDCPNPVVSSYNGLTDYTLEITYNNGCVVSARARIFVDNNLDVFIPNAFSPNGDGNNDLVYVYGRGIREVDLKIFNRWGELVFETTNQNVGWDGTYKGVLQSPAAFVYYVKITYLDNRVVSRTGSITLLK